jgi:AcrR family transcriptional regulator
MAKISTSPTIPEKVFMSSPHTRGRPLSSSREMLQEAAFELFLENGYAGTTVDAIAQRTGVSRATFFNYFPTKSDVFWVDLDESFTELRTTLRGTNSGVPVMTAIRGALLRVAAQFGPDRVPWGLTHYSMIGSVHELQASAMVRLGAESRIIAEFLARSLTNLNSANLSSADRAAGTLLASAAAYAAIGATVAAALSWAQLGTGRGPLAPHLDAALLPVCEGYQRAFDSLGHNELGSDTLRLG